MSAPGQTSSPRLQDFTTRLLFDTNVWLDYYDALRPAHGDAMELYSYAKRQGIALLYAVHCAKDVFFLLNATLKRGVIAEKGRLSDADALVARDAAWGALEHLHQEAFAVGADESDVWLACRLRNLHGDFEDNLLVAAVRRAEATYLVTNDEQLIRHAPVPTLSSCDALAALRAMR